VVVDMGGSLLFTTVIASEAKQSMDVAEKEWIASSLRSSQ
jgi:hypothetical protein